MEITLETLHDNQEALRELVSSVLTLLNKEKGKTGRQKEEKDNQPTMPPIPNSVAAALLRLSTVTAVKNIGDAYALFNRFQQPPHHTAVALR